MYTSINKKGNIVTQTIFWIFCTFFYFAIGLPIFNEIVDSIIEQGVILNPIYIFMANVAPFIPVIALLYMAWLSTQSSNEDESGISSLFGR